MIIYRTEEDKCMLSSRIVDGNSNGESLNKRSNLKFVEQLWTCVCSVTYEVNDEAAIRKPTGRRVKIRFSIGGRGLPEGC